jgi:hypothetical protein
MFKYLLGGIVAFANALLISFEVVEDAKFSLFIRDSIVVRQALWDLADATELFYLVWKAITSVNITSASLFIISSIVILSMSNQSCNSARE